MCNREIVRFARRYITPEMVRGKRVLEIGAYNVNGTCRHDIEKLAPAEYIGIDLRPGRCVDMICKAEDVIDTFGKESFDFVLSTEMLEHAEDWRRIVSNMKNICKPNGHILLTTRSYGFKKHDYPADYWRFEIIDMVEIFSDCEILWLENDSFRPGVLMLARKPVDFQECDYSRIKLFSMVHNKRIAL